MANVQTVTKLQTRLRILNPNNPFFPKPNPKNPNPLWDWEGDDEED